VGRILVSLERSCRRRVSRPCCGASRVGRRSAGFSASTTNIGDSKMSAWRFTAAAAAAFCLFASSTTASAGHSRTDKESVEYKKHKLAYRSNLSKNAERRQNHRLSAHHRARRLALHRRPARQASHRHHHLALRRHQPEYGARNSRDFAGAASYYWEGTHVATGARFNPDGFTAAHRSLPFGTRVHVIDLASGRSVDVTINDRGPFVHGRVLDLSRGAAVALGMTGRGVTRIRASII
jgi:rare lipoprotein A